MCLSGGFFALISLEIESSVRPDFGLTFPVLFSSISFGTSSTYQNNGRKLTKENNICDKKKSELVPKATGKSSKWK